MRSSTLLPTITDTATPLRTAAFSPVMLRQATATRWLRPICASATRLRLCATLSGVGFYAALGYRRLGRRMIRLADRTGFACVDMEAAVGMRTAA